MNPRLEKNRVGRILRRWFDAYSLESLPFEIIPELVEVPFAIPIDSLGKYIYCGKMDFIAPLRGYGSESKWVVVDIKSTRQITSYWLKSWEMDTQVSGYVYAARKQVPYDVIGMILLVIEIPNIKVSSRKCPEHGVPYVECDIFHANFRAYGPIERTDAQLQSWRLTMMDAFYKYEIMSKRFAGIEDVQHILQEGMLQRVAFSNACTSCRYQPFCESGRPVIYTDLLREEEAWFPVELSALT